MRSGCEIDSTPNPRKMSDEVCEAIKTMSPVEVLQVMKACVAAMSKLPKEKKATKKGSMPKGQVPQQLERPRAWVDYTLKDARQNGWEPFAVMHKKKDKETGEVTEEQEMMSGSEMHEGAYVFQGSVDEKTPKGRQIIHKDAMSLSAQRWRPATKGPKGREASGTHEAMYQEFLTAYEAPAEEVVEAVEAAEEAVVAAVEVEIDMTPPKAPAQVNKKDKKKK